MADRNNKEIEKFVVDNCELNLNNISELIDISIDQKEIIVYMIKKIKILNVEQIRPIVRYYKGDIVDMFKWIITQYKTLDLDVIIYMLANSKYKLSVQYILDNLTDLPNDSKNYLKVHYE